MILTKGSFSAVFDEKITLFDGIGGSMKPFEIAMPDPPSLINIDGYKKPQEEQKWRRTPMPKNFKNFSNKQKREFIDQEWKRRTKGHWFMNNGKLKYISGMHYFYLNWWRCDWGFPHFWGSDAEYFLFWEEVKKNKNAWGMINLESRQRGKSHRAQVMLYEEISRRFGRVGGIQSKNDADAYKFFAELVYSWRNLPYFFRPKFDNTSDPSVLLFKNMTKKGEKAKEELLDWDSLQQIVEDNPKELQLNSKIDYKSSKQAAYDNTTLFRYVADEAGKMEEETDVYDRWDAVKPALTDRTTGLPKGKAIFTTTVEFMEKQSGKRFQKLWNDSGEEGTSGLMKYLLPHYKCEFLNEFGEPDEEKAIREWEKNFNKLKPERQASFRRKNIRHEKDAFATPSHESHFNMSIIDRRLDILEPYYTSGKERFEWYTKGGDTVQGNFGWSMKDQQVQFYPDDKGRFIVSYLFDSPSQANRMGIGGGQRYPMNTNFGVAGADPFAKSNYGAKKQKWHSDGGIAVYRKFDGAIDSAGVEPFVDEGHQIIINHKTDRFICTYRYRQPIVEDFFEDVLMCCVYYGVKVYPEQNVKGLEKYFENRGFAGYLYFDINNKTRKYETESGDVTTDKIHVQIANLFRTYIQKNGMRELHRELFSELKELDDDPNQFDRYIAAGYALMAAQKEIPVTEQKLNISDFLPEIDYPFEQNDYSHV